MKKIYLTILIIAALLYRPSSSLGQSYNGTDFWFAFMQNGVDNAPTLELYISAKAAALVSIEIPLLGWKYSATPTSIAANTTKTIPIPLTISGNKISIDLANNEKKSNLGIHVTSDVPITVYGMNRKQYTTDGFLAIPTQSLGTEYIVPAPATELTSPGTNVPSQFVVVATEDGTNLTITPAGLTYNSKPPKIAFSVTGMNKGQTYIVMSELWGELSGSIVSSNKPVAVLGGNWCAGIGGCLACDHLCEQVPPVVTWGKVFYTAQFAIKTAPDKLRVIASQSSTSYTVNGVGFTLVNKGDFIDHDILESAVSKGTIVVSDKPIFCLQMCRGLDCDAAMGNLDPKADPFIVNILPEEQWSNSYSFSTAGGAGFSDNFITLITKSANRSTFLKDGVSAYPIASWTQIGTSDFYYTRPAIAKGAHIISATSPFGLIVYGYDSYDSYGFPGGGFLNNLAAVPIELLSFDAKNVADKVALSWFTASEINNDYFEVERSIDGILYQSIGKLAGALNSVISQSYSLIDPSPEKGLNYYRLRQVDKDGKTNYSGIKSIVYKSGEVFEILSLQPNPVNDELQLNFESGSQNSVSYQVIDLVGREVMKGSITEVSTGNNEILINTSGLDKGVYYLMLEQQNAEARIQKKLIKN